MTRTLFSQATLIHSPRDSPTEYLAVTSKAALRPPGTTTHVPARKWSVSADSSRTDRSSLQNPLRGNLEDASTSRGLFLDESGQSTYVVTDQSPLKIVAILGRLLNMTNDRVTWDVNGHRHELSLDEAR